MIQTPQINFTYTYIIAEQHEHLGSFGILNMNGRIFDPNTATFFSPDPFVVDASSTQAFNRYSYCLNNPLMYIDPSGEFITWSFSKSGFSIGLNFTPLGIPLGFGINVGVTDGGSVGLYGEVGYRVGFCGVAASQSINYGFKDGNWSTTTSVGASFGYGLFNAGANYSNTYDFTTKKSTSGWGVSAGINLLNDPERGVGLSISYGSGGWSFGGGGYYNSPDEVYTSPISDNFGGISDNGMCI